MFNVLLDDWINRIFEALKTENVLMDLAQTESQAKLIHPYNKKILKVKTSLFDVHKKRKKDP